MCVCNPKTNNTQSGQRWYAGVAIPGWRENVVVGGGDRSGRQQLGYKWGRLNDRGGGMWEAQG